MSATAYDVSYPAYPRSSFPPSMAALNSSHLSPLFDVSPLLYPPTPQRDVSSSSSTTFFPNDATQQQQQRFTTVAQHMHSEQFNHNHSSSTTPATSASSTTQHASGTQPHNLSAFLSSLTSNTAPHSPLSIHQPPTAGASYFDYTDANTHSSSNGRSPLSFTHQQQLLHHRMLQAKAAVAVPASPLSVHSDMNSVSGGSAHDLFPTSDSGSSQSSQSPQHLSSVSAMSPPPPPLPPAALHSYSHTQPTTQSQQPHTAGHTQPSTTAEGKKRKGVLSRKIACNVCHLAKTSCDGARPCSRCVRLLKTAQCVDRPSKMACKNKVSAAAGGTTVDEPNTTAAATTHPTTTAAVPPAPVDGSSTLHGSSAHTSGRAAAEQPQMSSVNPSRRALSAVVEDVDIDDEHNDSDRSMSHSHSGDEWCDTASDHSSFSSADDDSDSLDSLLSPSYSSSSSLSVDEHISRSLLRAHISWINKQQDDCATNPTQRMDLREKLIYFTWIRHMMQPEDVEHIIHYSEVYHRHQHNGGFGPQAPDAGCSGMKRPVTPPPFRRRRQPYQPCDGSVCNNFCPTARAWAASNPVVFSWHASPTAAVVDSAYNSYAVLVCRNLQDPSEVEQQTRTIVATTLMLREREKVRQRLEVASKGRTESTVHICPIVEDCGSASASAATPPPHTQPPSSSSAAANSVQFDDGVQGFDTIINMCGVSPQEMSRLHAAREEQREQQEEDRDDDFASLALRAHAHFPASTRTNNGRQPTFPSSSSASASASASSSSSPSSTLPPPVPIEVALSIHVNPPFERLFGYSQAELRQHFIRDGGKALYYLTRRDEWEKLMELDQEATWGREQEYRTYAVIVNKYKGEVQCLVHTVYEMHNDGKFKQSTTSFIPLPEEKREVRERDRDRERERSRGRRGGGGGGGDRERERSRSRSRRRKEKRHNKSGRGASSGEAAGKQKRRGRDEGKRS